MKTNTIFNLRKEKGSAVMETALLLALFCTVVVVSVANVGTEVGNVLMSAAEPMNSQGGQQSDPIYDGGGNNKGGEEG